MWFRYQLFFNVSFNAWGPYGGDSVLWTYFQVWIRAAYVVLFYIERVRFCLCNYWFDKFALNFKNDFGF